MTNPQPTTVQDTRAESLNVPNRRYGVMFGLMLAMSTTALAADALSIGIEPGVVVVDDHAYQYPGTASLAVYSGSTLAASKELKSVVIAYYSDETNRVNVAVVDGSPDTAGSAVYPTEAVCSAAAGGGPFTVIAGVTFRTDGSSVASLYAVDYTCRSYDVELARKEALTAATPGNLSSAPYRFWGRLPFSFHAADIANGDLLTNYPLPPIRGKIGAWRVLCLAPITTGAKTATLNLEIGSTDVTGTATAYAGTKAIGTVTTLGAPSAANTFVPGDTLSIEAASVTAFVEGKVVIEVDIYELVLG